MTEPVPFTVIIPALNGQGLSNRDIAYLLSVNAQTVANWAKGKGQPPYSTGAEIVALYQRYCASQADQL